MRILFTERIPRLTLSPHVMCKCINKPNVYIILHYRIYVQSSNVQVYKYTNVLSNIHPWKTGKHLNNFHSDSNKDFATCQHSEAKIPR